MGLTIGHDTSAAEQIAQAGGEHGVRDPGRRPLKNARYLEPLAGLNIYFGYGAGMGTTVAPTWLRKA